MAIPLLPLLDPAPYQVPLVDPKTGMMTDAWRLHHINLERVMLGSWKYQQPINPADFTTGGGPGVTWTVPGGLSNHLLQYYRIGALQLICWNLGNTTISADTAQLRITLPELRESTLTSGVFTGPCLVTNAPAAIELGRAYMVNGLPVATIYIERASGVNFTAASPSIDVSGFILLECDILVTP